MPQSLFAEHGNLFNVVESLQRSNQVGRDSGASHSNEHHAEPLGGGQGMTPGVPVTPMLGVAAKDCAEVGSRLPLQV